MWPTSSDEFALLAPHLVESVLDKLAGVNWPQLRQLTIWWDSEGWHISSVAEGIANCRSDPIQVHSRVSS
jgi:hypothetical protein